MTDSGRKLSKEGGREEEAFSIQLRNYWQFHLIPFRGKRCKMKRKKCQRTFPHAIQLTHFREPLGDGMFPTVNLVGVGVAISLCHSEFLDDTIMESSVLLLIRVKGLILGNI